MIVTPEHSQLFLSEDFKALCSPLQLFNIHQVVYHKIYKNGERICLSTDSNWVLDYFNLQLFESSFYDIFENKTSSKIDFWFDQYDAQVYQHGRDFYHGRYTIVAVEQTEKYKEYFVFSLKKEHFTSMEYLSRHTEVIYHFIAYCKEKGRDILSPPNIKLISPNLNKGINLSSSTAKSDSIFDESIEKFIKMTPIRTFSITSKHEQQIHLTSQQLRCCLCLLKNMTIKESAIALNLSPRTVEHYVGNIMDKFNCKSKYELLSTLSSSMCIRALSKTLV